MNLVTTRSPNFGSGCTSRLTARRRRDISQQSLLGPLGAVERTALATILDALRVEHAAQDVVADARKVLHAATADQDHGVFLQVVAFAGDVAHSFDAGGQTDLGDLTKRRVRLLRGRGVDPGADAAALRATLQGRDLVPHRLVLPGLADELVDCRHLVSLAWRRVPFGRGASVEFTVVVDRGHPMKRKNSPGHLG